VIFDCDGVLVDSEAISNAVLARMLTREGLPTTLEQARRSYQGPLLADVLASAERALGRALPEDLLVRYQHERDEAFRCELEPVAGAGETVERIMGAGIKVCVASQGALAKMRLTLALTGLEHHFPDGGRFSAEAVPRGKPFPDLFLHAASTMEVSPAECVVVEDTPTGVTAARAAGMRAVGLAADSDEASLRAADAEIIHSLAELPSLLNLG
jgi:beta-phosphoglucomutase-like phosphatase (HAD superfamily)